MEIKLQDAGTEKGERRRQQRYPLQLPVELHSPEGEADSAQGGQTCDISATGLYVRGSATLLQEGCRVHLNVRLPAGPEGYGVELRGQGRVVRVDRQPEHGMGVAVTFDRIEFSADDLESFT